MGDYNTSDPTVMEMLNQLQSDLQQVNIRNHQLESQLNTLANLTPESTPSHQAQASAEPFPTASLAIRAPRMRDPDPYDGDREKLYIFLTQCELIFAGSEHQFATEHAKVLYAISYLRGPAFTWAQPYIGSSHRLGRLPQAIDSWRSFSTSLTDLYGDRNLVRNKEQELMVLNQATSVAAYAAEFRRIEQYLAWNEPALMAHFYRGLRPGVKDGLVSVQPFPENLTQLIEDSNRIDSRISERQLERRATSMAQTNPRPTATQNPRAQFNPRVPQLAPNVNPPTLVAPTQNTQTPISAGGPTPMELDSSSSRRITEAEKQRRRDNHLCMYCGGSNHFRANCPYRRPPHPQAHAAAWAPDASSRPGSPPATSMFSVDLSVPEPSTNGYTRE
jgi:Retrotransposon gag protein